MNWLNAPLMSVAGEICREEQIETWASKLYFNRDLSLQSAYTI